ncbi:MAG: hypothetical protein GY725_22880 [bacterium]|nr:hypothetical protein [bacterium]
MKRVFAVLGLATLLGGCGQGIPLEEIPDEPIAYIRQKASEGILGFNEFRNAVRIENPEKRETLKTRLMTALALIHVPSGTITEIPDAGLGSIALDWSYDGHRLLVAKINRGGGPITIFTWNRLTGSWNQIRNAQVGIGASLGSGPLHLAWSVPIKLSNEVSHSIFAFSERDRVRGQFVAKNGTNPDIARDGRAIMYTTPPQRRGRDGVIMLAELGKEPRPITRGSFPRYSRDGKWIAFLRNRNGNSDVWMMRSDGTARRKVTDTPFDEEFPCPSPDGRYVVYASTRNADQPDLQLYLSRVSDAVEIQITHGGQNGRPVW